MKQIKQIVSFIQLLLMPVFRFLKRKAKGIQLPGFQQINLYQIIQFLTKQLNTLGLYDRASAISFNLIMALPAGLLFLFSIIPYFPKPLKQKNKS